MNLKEQLESAERDAIITSLLATNGCRRKTVDLLGMGLRTLMTKLADYRAHGYSIPPAKNSPITGKRTQ